MSRLKEYFGIRDGGTQNSVARKNDLIKRGILAKLAAGGERTLAELANDLDISIPTATKLVNELAEEGIVRDLGKVETAGGRRPNIFGLADSSVYFLGADIRRDRIEIVITDIKNSIIASSQTAQILADSEEYLSHTISQIKELAGNSGLNPDDICGAGVSVTGRVDTAAGASHRLWGQSGKPLRDTLEEHLGVPVHLDNGTRARCHAEYSTTDAAQTRDMLFINLGRGMAIGIVADGKLYYGKSGLAGEFGHTPMFDNNVICSCGKRGCLETEVSGIAIENKMKALIENGVNTVLRSVYEQTGTVHLDDIVEAARRDDTLSIELIEEAAGKAGKAIAMLLNIFNPELVVLGGNLAEAGDYVMLPLRAATNKHTVGPVYNDTRFRLAEAGPNAGAVGSAIMIRNKIIGLP